MADGTLKVGTIITSSGSGTITLGQSNETVALGSGATSSGFGGANTPAFFAYLGSDQNISNATNTTVAFNTEIFDTANAFNTSTHKYTIPSGQGGKYFITVLVYFRVFTLVCIYIYIYIYI